jgi:hypothetical protein
MAFLLILSNKVTDKSMSTLRASVPEAGNEQTRHRQLVSWGTIKYKSSFGTLNASVWLSKFVLNQN